jgi:hypothetical protein
MPAARWWCRFPAWRDALFADDKHHNQSRKYMTDIDTAVNEILFRQAANLVDRAYEVSSGTSTQVELGALVKAPPGVGKTCLLVWTLQCWLWIVASFYDSARDMPRSVNRPGAEPHPVTGKDRPPCVVFLTSSVIGVNQLTNTLKQWCNSELVRVEKASGDVSPEKGDTRLHVFVGGYFWIKDSDSAVGSNASSFLARVLTDQSQWWVLSLVMDEVHLGQSVQSESADDEDTFGAAAAAGRRAVIQRCINDRKQTAPPLCVIGATATMVKQHSNWSPTEWFTAEMGHTLTYGKFLRDEDNASRNYLATCLFTAVNCGTEDPSPVVRKYGADLCTPEMLTLTLHTAVEAVAAGLQVLILTGRINLAELVHELINTGEYKNVRKHVEQTHEFKVRSDVVHGGTAYTDEMKAFDRLAAGETHVLVGTAGKLATALSAMADLETGKGDFGVVIFCGLSDGRQDFELQGVGRGLRPRLGTVLYDAYLATRLLTDVPKETQLKVGSTLFVAREDANTNAVRTAGSNPCASALTPRRLPARVLTCSAHFCVSNLSRA